MNTDEKTDVGALYIWNSIMHKPCHIYFMVI